MRLLFLITLFHEFYLCLSDVKLGFLSLFNDRLPVFGDLVVSLSRFLGNLFTLPLSVFGGLCGFSLFFALSFLFILPFSLTLSFIFSYSALSLLLDAISACFALHSGQLFS